MTIIPLKNLSNHFMTCIDKMLNNLNVGDTFKEFLKIPIEIVMGNCSWEWTFFFFCFLSLSDFLFFFQFKHHFYLFVYQPVSLPYPFPVLSPLSLPIYSSSIPIQKGAGLPGAWTKHSSWLWGKKELLPLFQGGVRKSSMGNRLPEPR